MKLPFKREKPAAKPYSGIQPTGKEPFRMLIQHSQEGIFLLDEKGIILESNPAINRLYQTDTRNFVGQPVWQFDQNFLPREQRNKKQLRGFVQTIQNFLP